MNYERIIPRDLFNEAKLLKCMGRLALLVHDRQTPCKIDIDYNGAPFEIRQSQDDGGLYISNFRVYVKGERCRFLTSYNSKRNYPLLCEHQYAQFTVFDNEGNWDEEFISFVDSIK